MSLSNPFSSAALLSFKKGASCPLRPPGFEEVEYLLKGYTEAFEPALEELQSPF
jgi:hypothetical protein